jgi:two-component system, sensor histidine kinase YesM
MVSIIRRFNLVFLLLVVLPSLLVSVVLSRLSVSAMYSTASRQTESVIDQIAQNIETETDGTMILASALIHDGELRLLVNRYARASGPTDRITAANGINLKLDSFFTYTSRIGAIVIYPKMGNPFTYSNYPNIRSLDRIGPEAYREAEQNPGRVQLLDSLTGVAGNIGEKFMLSVAVCPLADDSDSELAALLVMLRIPYFDRLTSGFDTASEVVVFGRGGAPILSSFSDPAAAKALAPLLPAEEGEAENQAQTPTDGFRQISFRGRSWNATTRRLSSSGWTIAFLVDRSSITGKITLYNIYLAAALLILTVLFFIYAEIFFSRIANPIRSVVRSMRLVGEGDYAVRVPASGIEELTELTGSFNRMVSEIHRLTGEREEKERERMKAELEALRYQIDPHFVANTLNSIRLMAQAARVPTIRDMTQALMRLLSESYSGGDAFVELDREIDNVRSYVAIMKVRFGEQFDVVYDVGEGAADLLVLRMILQPIVENSILHGIAGASRRGTIGISCRLVDAEGRTDLPFPVERLAPIPGKRLVIEVRDDGIGMEPEKLESALAEPAANDSGSPGSPGHLRKIGLVNVHRRIALNFGEPFGLSIESERDSHTLVRFLLPALRKVGSDEPGTDR